MRWGEEWSLTEGACNMLKMVSLILSKQSLK